MTRYARRVGKIWLHIFPDKPVSGNKRTEIIIGVINENTEKQDLKKEDYDNIKCNNA